MTPKKLDKLPDDLPKAPGKAHWVKDDLDYVLLLGDTVIGKLLGPSTVEGSWGVWGRTPGGQEGVSDSTGRFHGFDEAVEALLEHVEEYGTSRTAPEKPPKEDDEALLAALVRDIRVRSTAIGTLALGSGVGALTTHFVDAPWLLGLSSSAALAAGVMALVWRAEAGKKDG